ncbi:CPBP family intramembrane glutamic endopeptidase [Tabrizicola sp.]|uniref:CPBP family intramembrane glutamic endopeptidase n=1 Tax=Tabrizicola sp. TaxID=2005166 RepID=UPI003F2BF09E
MQSTINGRGNGSFLLWVEFLGLYILIPLGLAVILPPGAMFPVLFVLAGVSVLGVFLLHKTPSFAWRDLLAGMERISWGVVAGFALVVLAGSLAVILLTRPDAAFSLPQERPGLWLLTLALYPILSALPQEAVFRPLFFRRYAALLPSGAAAIVLNAAVFSLAHLMFWNWIVLAMTFVGGLVFAWAYEARRSFPLAVLLHSVAGWILFTVGLGVYFYAGNAVRPF